LLLFAQVPLPQGNPLFYNFALTVENCEL
jgi:hypothetical protein